ncbi:MAG TPA: methyltransferase domain-containing protein [Gammaproteobacteria bacterium]|nr:methyltransferase domain-containing protein [Gammaproteobacteria bacterium]
MANQPDWHDIAEKFDMWLPFIQPVGDQLLVALAAQAGDKILDVASGTGEPALTLARQMGESVTIHGVDAAEGMVKVAQGKADKEALNNISFAVMSAEKLRYEDNYFDKVLCRFGVMLFDNPLAGVKEIRRVLKVGGAFAIAVWAEANKMTTLSWSYEALKDKIPEAIHPPLKNVTSLGGKGAVEALFSEAGFSDINVSRCTFNYEFESFEDYWRIVQASNLLKVQFEALSELQCQSVKEEIAEFAEAYRANGRYIVPHDCLLVTGGK